MDTSKLLAYQNASANKTTVWLLFLFLGWSYGSMDKIGLQIVYYLTPWRVRVLGIVSPFHP